MVRNGSILRRRQEPLLHLAASPVHQLRLEMNLPHIALGISHVQQKIGIRPGQNGGPVDGTPGEPMLHILQCHIGKHHGIGRKTGIRLPRLIHRNHHALDIPGLPLLRLGLFLRPHIPDSEIQIPCHFIIRTGNGNRDLPCTFRNRRRNVDGHHLKHIAKISRKGPLHMNAPRLIKRPAFPGNSRKPLRKGHRNGNGLSGPVEMVHGHKKKLPAPGTGGHGIGAA